MHCQITNNPIDVGYTHITGENIVQYNLLEFPCLPYLQTTKQIMMHIYIGLNLMIQF